MKTNGYLLGKYLDIVNFYVGRFGHFKHAFIIVHSNLFLTSSYNDRA